MRLQKLSIDGFKNLKRFEISFDERSPYTVLVGRNGSGKSNLIEALVAIFRSLDSSLPAPFRYLIVYSQFLSRGGQEGRSAVIQIEAEANSLPTCSVDGVDLPRSELLRPESPYLPRFIFAYYSGPSDRLRSYFAGAQERFYRKLKAPGTLSNALPARRLFLTETVHSQFVLLAFFSHADEVGQAFLQRHLAILGLDFVRFVINRPAWAGSATEDRFWGTTGVPRQMLELLEELSIATTKTSRKILIGFRRYKTLECWNFMLDQTAFQKMAKHYASPQDLFKALESTLISDLLLELTVDVRVRNVDGSISHRELSEGEQQLLLVLGLLRFTKQDDALFLLDEPDTHLNPAWSVQFLDFINEIVGEQPASHIVMATHDPLVFSGLLREQVRIMELGDDRRVSAAPPDEDPRGMGVESILTSDLFGLRAALDLPTLAALDERRRLAIAAVETPEKRQRLGQLNEQLERLGFADNADPVFSAFADAMARWQEEQGVGTPVLTPAERQRQREAALEIMRRLKKGQE